MGLGEGTLLLSAMGIDYADRELSPVMTSVLITAFEPYEPWETNASWLAMLELTKDLPTGSGAAGLEVTTRLYPVDFSKVREKLAADLTADYDYAIHLGQAPGRASVQLESIGINIGGTSQQTPEDYRPLVEDGPVAFRSSLPLAEWSMRMRKANIPAQVSYFAGTFLCNAMLYLTHYLAQQEDLKTQATFIHLPLDASQTMGQTEDYASLPASTSAAAVRIILQELA